MVRPLNYTITIPNNVFNVGIKTEQTASVSHLTNALSSSNNSWSTSALSSISSLQLVSSTDIRSNVSGFFGDSILCQKIAQIWKQLCDAISDCFSKIYRWICSPFMPPAYPIINVDMSKDTLQKIYWGLGKENKWMECIDGRYHNLGKDVFDRGTHQGTVEPGFIASMEETFGFVHNFINSKIDADWYLLLHKHTCAHFNGDPSAFLMGQEKVGVFRTSDDYIRCAALTGFYAVTPEARAEFQALDQALKSEFGDSYGLGEMVYNDAAQTSTCLDYKPMSRDQVRRIFNKFLFEFYQEIERATTPDQKLWTIAKLHQRLEWLHPVRDGTARTSTALMNKFLTDYGFHPAILEYPHVSTTYGLAQWKQYLQNGLLKWEEQRARLNPTSSGG
jgi:hypothetical protein